MTNTTKSSNIGFLYQKSNGSVSLTDTTTYYANYSVGNTYITFTDVFYDAFGSCKLTNAYAYYEGDSSLTGFELYLFSRTPSSTIADGTTFTISPSDLPYFLGISFLDTNSYDSGTFYTLTSGTTPISILENSDGSTNLYGVLVANPYGVGGITALSSPLNIYLNVQQD